MATGIQQYFFYCKIVFYEKQSVIKYGIVDTTLSVYETCEYKHYIFCYVEQTVSAEWDNKSYITSQN